jgi:hypothetical protein
MRWRAVWAVLVVPLFLGQTLPATGPATGPARGTATGPATVAATGRGGMEAELARLRAENAQLREELKKAKEQVAGKGIATAPKARAFTTMLEVLEDVPAELRPQPKPEWYKYTEGKFGAWWKEQLVGMEFERKLVVGKVNAMRKSVPRPGAEWIIHSIPLSGLSFSYFGAEHRIAVTVPGVELDEAGAREWDKVKEGMTLGVKGVIREVVIKLRSSDRQKMPVYEVELRLRDVEYVVPK